MKVTDLFESFDVKRHVCEKTVDGLNEKKFQQSVLLGRINRHLVILP